MAKPTLKDRFFTPPVAHALTSPLGIVVAGVGVAVGLVANLPIAAAVGIGAVAYGVRVAAAIPKGRQFDGINPFSLEDPWRTFVWQAKKSQRQFADAVEHTHSGPLRDRLREIADRIDTGVDECWQVAQTGQRLTEARARIDIGTITRDLSALPTGQPLQANTALLETARALQAQLDSAKRMDSIITDTRDRLRLLDARLGELVTRVIELSVRPQAGDDLAAIGADVDAVVGEMESLRQALDESDRIGTGALPAAGPIASAPLPTAGPTPAPAPTPLPPVAPPAIVEPPPPIYDAIPPGYTPPPVTDAIPAPAEPPAPPPAAPGTA